MNKSISDRIRKKPARKVFFDNDEIVLPEGVRGSPFVAAVIEDKTCWLNKEKVLEEGLTSEVYVGSGECCNGHLTRYLVKPMKPRDIMSVDFIVYDILPMFEYRVLSGTYYGDGRKEEKWGFFIDHPKLLVTGMGCSGDGVRLLDMYHHEQKDILPKLDMTGLDCIYFKDAPRFDVSEGKISLRYGRIKNVDLTERLRDEGFRIEDNIKLWNEKCGRKLSW